MRHRLLLAFAGLLAITPLAAQTAALPTIEEKTAGMRRLDGFLPVYWDERGGRLWLEVPLADEELIFIASRATGMGSNDIGLDRSQVGEGKIVRFDRVGPKLLLVQPNYAYRAESPDSSEKPSIKASSPRCHTTRPPKSFAWSAACLRCASVVASSACCAGVLVVGATAGLPRSSIGLTFQPKPSSLASLSAVSGAVRANCVPSVSKAGQ